MNPTNLRYFRIYGLFGRYDVHLTFDKEVNIYIGENGLGKTTILNCLYYVLNKNFSQLANIEFRKLKIGFKNVYQEVEITKADLLAYNKTKVNHFSRYDDEMINVMFEEFNVHPDFMGKLDEEQIDLLVRNISDEQGIPRIVAKKYIYNYMNTRQDLNRHNMRGESRKVKTLARAINENLHENVIYLPTYRRIENDFTNLRFRELDGNSTELLIRFGMADVQKSIDSILNKIRDLAVQGYNELTGFLLEQYTEEDSFKTTKSPTIDLGVVRIVMDRLGSKIEKNTKEKIIDLIKTNNIYNFQHTYLLNLLEKLISNYDLQKRYDDRINNFAETCNKYLNDKHFHYNPSDLTLEIILNNHVDGVVKLTQLSSGEKQIVSLFSKLYLESDEKNIIIIDEPELSLSISWQQMLLPDIMRSQNCSLLVAVTHSPFVFENEFDMDAEEIRTHMSLI